MKSCSTPEGLKVRETVPRDFLFADDCTISASHEQEMQVGMDSFCSSCNNIDLTISTKKTEIMFQPAPGNKYHKLQISVNRRAVETFTYLGSTLTHNANIDSEINNTVSKASSTFGRLRVNVWERKGISLETKLKVYQAVVLTTVLLWNVIQTSCKTTKPSSISDASVIFSTSAAWTKSLAQGSWSR